MSNIFRHVYETFKEQQMTFDTATVYIEKLKDELEPVIPRENIIAAGSYRRGKSIIGDLDLIVIRDVADGEELYPQVVKLFQSSGHKVVVKTMGHHFSSMSIDDFLVEFKITTREQLGAMELYATGKVDFNLGMRGYAKSKGYALSQYGLSKDGKIIASEKEEDIFKALNAPYVAPKDRQKFLWPKDVKHEDGVPTDILDKIPEDVRVKVKDFKLPEKDETGRFIPRDFLYNKTSRHNFYKSGGKYKIPDDLKLDRYLINKEEV